MPIDSKRWWSSSIRRIPLAVLFMALVAAGLVASQYVATLQAAETTTVPQAMRLDALSGAAGGLLIMALVGWLVVWRRANRSLTRVTQAARAEGQALRSQIDQLTAQRNRVDAVLASMTEGVVALDAEGRILLMNPAAAALFGTEAAGAEGRPLLEVVRQHALDSLLKDVLSKRQPATREFTVFQPTERILRAHAVPCETGQSSGPSFIIVMQDLSEIYKYERLRKDFVANVSHELKSPLTAIRSLTETLLTGALNDPTANTRFVTLIDEETARLGRLIDDLLQLSQIESRESKPAVQAVDLPDVLERLLPAFRAELTKRRISLSTELDSAARVAMDPDHLKQVLLNLLDNAIKYNRDGGTIRVTARAEGATVRIDVADTGIGIPEADLPRIFERFYRVDKARSRELGGTGLGLSIVKHLIETYAGHVSVDSRLHEGSVFSVIVPRYL